MKSFLISGALMASAAAVPMAEARPLSITVDAASFSGPKAYVAVYLTDPQGKLYDTLWVAGPDTRYHSHLSNWSRMKHNSKVRISAVTGASLRSGGSLKFSADIANSKIAAGYKIMVDASIEDRGDWRRAAVLTLGKQTSTDGGAIIRRLTVHQ